HASSDVERMILGNKCDMNDKRQVSRERGEKAFFTLARDIMTRLNRKMNDSNATGGAGPVKITENRSKKSSFFRCTLL
ncbi:hypothetical protein Z043_111667, partial [Scleropages formosus]